MLNSLHLPTPSHTPPAAPSRLPHIKPHPHMRRSGPAKRLVLGVVHPIKPLDVFGQGRRIPFGCQQARLVVQHLPRNIKVSRGNDRHPAGLRLQDAHRPALAIAQTGVATGLDEDVKLPQKNGQFAVRHKIQPLHGIVQSVVADKSAQDCRTSARSLCSPAMVKCRPGQDLRAMCTA